VASCSSDRTIKLWNPHDGSFVRTLTGHSSSVNSILEVEDGIILSASDDRTIRVWNEKGECLYIWNATALIYGMIVLRDGSLLYASGKEKTIFVSPCWLQRQRYNRID